MKRYCLFIFTCFCCAVLGQNPDGDISLMQQKLRAFDYKTVITLADTALSTPARYQTAQLINIYEMKAVAHYTISELAESKASFLAILELDASHTLHPITTSPKIIEFFNSVKNEFERESAAQTTVAPEQLVVHDTLVVVRQILGNYKKSIPASLVVPGTGHWLMGEKKRGAILTAISALTLTSAIYTTDLTRRREIAYLNAVNEADIAAAYAPYDSAYKARNALWGTFAVLWIYAQADLLFRHPKRQALQLALQLSPAGTAPCRLSLQLRL